MKNALRVAVSGTLAVALSLCAGWAAAQVKETQSDAGYGYQFDDDPLNARPGGLLHALSRCFLVDFVQLHGGPPL